MSATSLEQMQKWVLKNDCNTWNPKLKTCAVQLWLFDCKYCLITVIWTYSYKLTIGFDQKVYQIYKEFENKSLKGVTNTVLFQGKLHLMFGVGENYQEYATVWCHYHGNNGRPRGEIGTDRNTSPRSTQTESPSFICLNFNNCPLFQAFVDKSKVLLFVVYRWNPVW